jgi:hypothetical protein
MLAPRYLHRQESETTSLLFDTATGNIESLNETGTAVLTQLAGGKTVREVLAYLGDRFEVPPDTDLDVDVAAFITNLRERAILLPTSSD